MKKLVYASLAGTIFICSCSSETKKEEITAAAADTTVAQIDSSKTPVNGLVDFKFYTAVANIPAPFGTISKLPQAELPFNKALTNTPDNESKYLTSTKKALNYGVFGVDLMYLAVHKEYSHVAKYFATTRNLAVSLDCVESFDKMTKSRMEGSNLENKDTIARIVDEAYEASDKYLKTSERQQAATQILTGSWIESVYITLNTIKGQKRNEKNDFLFLNVYEQKLNLYNLTSLLKEYEKIADFKPLIKKIEAFNDDFKSISTDKDITEAKVIDLATKIGAIRDMVIN